MDSLDDIFDQVAEASRFVTRELGAIGNVIKKQKFSRRSSVVSLQPPTILTMKTDDCFKDLLGDFRNCLAGSLGLLRGEMIFDEPLTKKFEPLLRRVNDAEEIQISRRDLAALIMASKLIRRFQ